MSSPTQRTLNLMRAEGYVAATVERYIAAIKKRQDLFGFIDVLCMHPDRKGLVGIQTTTGANLSARYKKALAIPTIDLFLDTGNTVEFHGWELKSGPKTKRKTWQCRRLFLNAHSLRQIRRTEVAAGSAPPSKHKAHLQAPPVPDRRKDAKEVAG